MSYNEVQRTHETAIELKRYAVRLWIVLSLVFSLAFSAILLSHHQDAIYACVLIVPLVVAYYFRGRIVSFGQATYVAALVGMLAAAVLFGV